MSDIVTFGDGDGESVHVTFTHHKTVIPWTRIVCSPPHVRGLTNRQRRAYWRLRSPLRGLKQRQRNRARRLK